MEQLEHRTLLATYTVTTANDSGVGSLRQAILNANSALGVDVIAFEIGLGGVRRITLATPLPAISGPVTLDGTTQPFNNRPFRSGGFIVLDGQNLATSSTGLHVTSSNCVIKGMVVNRFGTGMKIQGNGTVLERNRIGTNYSGASTSDSSGSLGNGTGISLASSSNTVGGTTSTSRNVISNNSGYGVVVNGMSNTILGNRIGVDLSGNTDLGNGLTGILLSAANTATVRSNVISGNTGAGVYITGGGSHLIESNLVGTNAQGSAALGNREGVHIENSPSNVLRDNTLSGNGLYGVYVFQFGGSSEGTQILSNRIGTDAAGAAALGNSSIGVYISDTGNSTVRGNVISANLSGLLISDSGGSNGSGSGNLIDSNLIGTDATGTIDLGNVGRGVTINGDADNNTISGNVISGNGGNGVYIIGGAFTTAQGNVIRGNKIGTNALGDAPIGNGSGIYVGGSSSNTSIEYNLISGNLSSGIDAQGTTSLVILGNWIGSDAAGNADLGNGTYGLFLESVSGASIGGNLQGQGNVVSGNAGYGIWIANSSGNTLLGNRIGTSAEGGASLGNDKSGLRLENSSDNRVGDGTDEGRNVVSGNTRNGIELVNDSNLNIILGNRVGTNSSGTVALGNGGAGIHILGSSDNMIGFSAPGAGNLISGNIGAGVEIFGYDLGLSLPVPATGNVLSRNRIGTNAAGTSALGNGSHGVLLFGASANRVGEGIPGSRNLISANYSGIRIDGLSAPAENNAILSNFVGVNAGGTEKLGNTTNGITLSQAHNNVIGGDTDAKRNVISGNVFHGLLLSNVSTLNITQGNYIGLNSAGTDALGNGEDGIQLENSPANQIGGAGALRNVVSSNGRYGIYLLDEKTEVNLIQGNYIGTNAAGTAAQGNAADGIYVKNAPRNSIGGLMASARNVVSGNAGSGIVLFGSLTTENEIQSNRIGISATGSIALGNGNYGVLATGDANAGFASNNAVTRNVIALNQSSGVRVEGGSLGISLRRNAIHSNAGKGILLVDDGNNLQPAPVISTATFNESNNATVVRGSLAADANTTYAVEFFRNDVSDPSGFGEGQSLLSVRSITTDASGNAVFAFGFGNLPAGKYVTATATSPGDNTSEFSNARIVIAPPILAGISTTPVGYKLNATVAAILAPTATVSDADSLDFEGGKLIVRITSGSDIRNRLELGGTLFSINASNQLLRSGVVIGTVNANAGRGLTKFEATFNADALPGYVQQLVRAMRFRTVNSELREDRAVAFTVTDGDGGISATRMRTVDVQ